MNPGAYTLVATIENHQPPAVVEKPREHMHLILAPNSEAGSLWMRRNTSDQNLRIDDKYVRRYKSGGGWKVIFNDRQPRGYKCGPEDVLFILPGVDDILIAVSSECWAPNRPTIVRL